MLYSAAGGGIVAKLSDFGFCGTEVLGEYQYLGTRLLNAPEVRQPGHLYSVNSGLAFMKCDIYSFGLLAWEVFNNGHRFYTSDKIGIGSNEHERAEKLLSTLEGAGSGLASYAQDFLQCLDCSPPTKQILVDVITLALSLDTLSRPQMVKIGGMLNGLIK